MDLRAICQARAGAVPASGVPAPTPPCVAIGRAQALRSAPATPCQARPRAGAAPCTCYSVPGSASCRRCALHPRQGRWPPTPRRGGESPFEPPKVMLVRAARRATPAQANRVRPASRAAAPLSGRAARATHGQYPASAAAAWRSARASQGVADGLVCENARLGFEGAQPLAGEPEGRGRPSAGCRAERRPRIGGQA